MNTVFEKGREFIYRNARPIEFALWKFHFENGAAEDVLNVLTAHQNDDGGFGHGLEADALNPGSSPIQTWCATTILRQIIFYDASHPIVAGILRYLVSGVHFDGHCWTPSVPGNNDYPHAPWWGYTEPAPSDDRNYNPTASLAGFMIRVSQPGSPANLLGRRIAIEAHDYFMRGKTAAEMHLLPCFLSLCSDVQTSCPDLFDCDAMFAKLRADVTECVLRDADRWDGNYCAHPSDFLIGEGLQLRSCFPELAEKECDFIVRIQSENGAWPVTWNWGAYPDEFAVSANFWRSHIVLKNLLYLKSMDRL